MANKNPTPALIALQLTFKALSYLLGAYVLIWIVMPFFTMTTSQRMLFSRCQKLSIECETHRRLPWGMNKWGIK